MRCAEASYCYKKVGLRRKLGLQAYRFSTPSYLLLRIWTYEVHCSTYTLATSFTYRGKSVLLYCLQAPYLGFMPSTARNWTSPVHSVTRWYFTKINELIDARSAPIWAPLSLLSSAPYSVSAHVLCSLVNLNSVRASLIMSTGYCLRVLRWGCGASLPSSLFLLLLLFSSLSSSLSSLLRLTLSK
jgi:hypothetical protein